MDRIPAPLLTASIWCAAMAGQIEAACNVIPDSKMLTVDTPAAAIPGTADRKRPEFGFKGALGRIDQIYVVPDRTSSLTVVPDGICVAPGSGPIAPSKIDPAKDVAL